MTITAEKPYRTDSVGNGVIVTFPTPFFVNANDLDVYIAESLVASGYTVAGEGLIDGGSITFEAPPASGAIVSVVRYTERTQEADYPQVTNFNSETHEAALDKGALIDQEIDGRISRTIRLADSDSTLGSSMVLPTKTNRANTAVTFNGSGSMIMKPLSDFTTSGNILTYISGGRTAFNVKDSAYGAVGDGLNDDTQAIQDCINAAELVGGLVYIPKGVYLISRKIVIDSDDVSIIGDKKASNIHLKDDFVKDSGVNYQGGFTFQNIKNFSIDDLKFTSDRVAQAATYSGQTIGVDHIYIENCEDYHVRGIFSSGALDNGIHIRGDEHQGANVRFCEIKDMGMHGIVGVGCGDFDIRRCHITGIGDAGAAQVALNNGGIGILISGTRPNTETGPQRNVHIERNIIDNMSDTATKTEDMHGVRYIDNIIQRHGKDGIKIMQTDNTWNPGLYVEDGIISGNTFESGGHYNWRGDGSAYILMQNVKGGTIADNYVFGNEGVLSLDNEECGIRIASFNTITTDINVEGNFVKGTNRGLYVYRASGLRFTQNHFQSNYTYTSSQNASVMLNGARCHFSGNKFIAGDDTETSIFMFSLSGVLNAERNYFLDNYFTGHLYGITSHFPNNANNTYINNDFDNDSNVPITLGATDFALNNKGMNAGLDLSTGTDAQSIIKVKPLTATTPSIVSSDSDSGLFFDSSGNPGLARDGVSRLSISSLANVIDLGSPYRGIWSATVSLTNTDWYSLENLTDGRGAFHLFAVGSAYPETAAVFVGVRANHNVNGAISLVVDSWDGAAPGRFQMRWTATGLTGYPEIRYDAGTGSPRAVDITAIYAI